MRIIPDLSRLIPDEAGNMAMATQVNNGYENGANSASPATLRRGTGTLNYEDSDLNSITRSQLNQDLGAYRYDLEFCQTELLSQPVLTPQETRTLQIRILDCCHNIRHCKHRIQTLEAQARLGQVSYATTGASRVSGVGTGGKQKKRRLERSEGGEYDGFRNGHGGSPMTGFGGEVDLEANGIDDGSGMAAAAGVDVTASPGPTYSLQRLGYWECRLCQTTKYLKAGMNRVPSAPCKWPLKDISKMINHFLDLHTEHTPSERCNELGHALAQNRGPFEYWLTRTKSQELEHDGVVDDYIRMLQGGSLPDAMRGLLRAATMFPNTVSTMYKKDI